MIKLKILEEIDESWSISEVAKRRPPPSWEQLFEDCIPEFQNVDEYIKNKEFYPLKQNLFRAFEFTPLHSVKVVIVGQDPYPQSINIHGKIVPRAQGLSFSVHREDSIPSSLSNIYKELKSTIPDFISPYHGDLTKWTRQGVLLLNQCLTVEPMKPGSHGGIWMGFIMKLLELLNNERPGTIFILWGKEAQKLEHLIGEKNIAITGVHPSGLSANRGFFGGDYFNKVNKLLKKQGKSEIDWKL
jgi:uracil-DNA glycosylase